MHSVERKTNELFKNLMDDTLQNTPVPALFLNLENLITNINYFKNKCQKKKIRIASKSVRSIEVLKLIEKNLGDTCSGIMAYHPDEALFLMEQGFKDILMGYPFFNSLDILNIKKFLEQNNDINFVFMVDRIEHIELISKCFEDSILEANLCIDLDMSLYLGNFNFGVFRSSIHNINDLQTLIEKALKLKNIKIMSMMGYEAQVAGIPDTIYFPLKNFFISLLKKRSIKNIEKFRHMALDLFNKYKLNCLIFNGGGTGSIDSTCAEQAITEVTIGSGFYGPILFDHYKSLDHHPALFFKTQITRASQNGMVTAYGGGYVASGAIGQEKVPKILNENLNLHPNELCGEVQTPLVDNTYSYKIGDYVFFRHSKAGELCEHFNDIYVINNNGKVQNKLKTYRGDGKSFL